MNSTTRFASAGMLFAIVAVLACWLSAFPTVANAQGSQGQDAVYNSSNGVVGSNAFIDASMFPATGRDFCGVLKFVLQNIDQPPMYPSGAVIDARGLPGNTGTRMTCAVAGGPPLRFLQRWGLGRRSQFFFLARVRLLLCPTIPSATTAPTICISSLAAATIANPGWRVRADAICSSRYWKKCASVMRVWSWDMSSCLTTFTS